MGTQTDLIIYGDDWAATHARRCTVYHAPMATRSTEADEVVYRVKIHRSEEIGGPTPLALNTEWLLTDGLGGFAMGSVSGCATRRYHGLLTVAARPPVERFNLLNSMAETLRFDGHECRLDCHEFLSPDQHSIFHPHGFQFLHRFEKTPSCVRWHYRAGPFDIVRELRVLWRRPAVVLSYTIAPAGGSQWEWPVTLELAPLIAMRDFHQHRRPDWGDPFQTHASNDADAARLTVTADIPLQLHLHAEGCLFSQRRDWWHNFRRRRETERGQDDLEGLFAPGCFTRTFERIDQPVTLRLYASTEPIDRNKIDADDGRGTHLRSLISHVAARSPGTQASRHIAGLVAASDDFITTRYVAGREFRTVLAGYPWFADWGRDTMISLPGLLLCTGRIDEAAQTLIAFARHIRGGLVPNRFDDYGGEPHYNTVDASLWFIHACLEYRQVCGEPRVWREVLAPSCRHIISAYEQGTDGPIAMDGDGLIDAGNDHTQLTWMDAKRDDVVFTPRHGKCVEINALWCRALAGCATALREEDAQSAARYAQMAQKAVDSFRRTFWRPDLGYLLDHVNPAGEDRSLRPNQVLAVSLPVDLLTADQKRSVMQIVREKLLTPLGLRTLPRDDPKYHPRHTGSMFQRDEAYHQGTVWPWLIGPYIEGWLRAHEFSDEAKSHGREVLEPLLHQLDRQSLGQIHEIYDGDEPHQPSGCIAQAWSVAEVLRAALLID